MSLAKRDDGCYECFRRRIKCDKGEPECLKCLKKGIACSGQGLRCRFSSHMGNQVPQSALFKKSASPKPQPNSPGGSATSRRKRNIRKGNQRLLTDKPETTDSYDDDSGSPRSDELQSLILAPRTHPQQHASSDTTEDISFVETSPWIPLAPSEVLHPQARLLYEHFAQNVAPVMVVLDTESNGYRDIILPMACQDTLLARAVSVTATFHLAQKIPELRQTAEAGQAAIIDKLRRDSIGSPSQVFNQFTLATLLVLLVGETITGADNYSYLLEMLECFNKAIDSKVLPLGLKEFFQQQIKMFQLFGFPLSNEEKGLQVMRSPTNYFDFMAYPDLPLESEHQSSLSIIRSVIWDACALYRRRVEGSVHQDESIHLIEQLRLKMLQLGMNVPGAHALVWACFIAAAESTIPEHRMFFTQRLLLLYNHTGFGSIPAALKALETLWAAQMSRKWTDVISDVPVLVM